MAEEEEEGLQTAIRERRVESRFGNRLDRFLPQGQLNRLITRDSILDAVEIEEDEVEEGDELLVKFVLQEAKKLFAILVTTRHPKLQEAISLFQKHNFDDTKLPIKFWTGQMFNDAQHPFFEMQGARKKKVWDKSLIYDFQEKQWEFLAPVLSTEETYHCYGNHVIMPFVAQIASFAEGSFGVVSKYEIHEDHMVIKDASQQITKPVCTAFGLN